MSKAAKSLFFFGIYILLTGLGFLLAPNLVLGTLGFQTTAEPWIYVVGVVALVLGYYYIQSARHELTTFFRFTVQARGVVILFFVALVLLKIGPLPLLVFGIVDLLGAIWTAVALRT
ncbi:hypothetical protein EH223_13410 [candidate division KSB1 bacterium]|nr:hypothetical protein [candidate division KSB1 bacterium]RQW02046.1 MAG: hypothetical protein EH223_13410 [candidate division KSB1 bacterium]